MSTKRLGLAALCGITLTIGGCVKPSEPISAATSSTTTSAERQNEQQATVRYQVTDVERAIAFYTGRLGFHLEQRTGSVFASVTLGSLRLVLSGPGSSGSRALPDGRRQEPGGFNRIVIYVPDLSARIEALKNAGTHFRNDVEVGPGGSQIQIEDPDGNPIELHEPPRS